MSGMRKHFWFGTALLVLLSSTVGLARADTVNVTSDGWLDSVLVRPQSLVVTDFFSEQAGFVTLSLGDIHTLTPQWGSALSELFGSVTTADGSLRSLAAGPPALIFAIGAGEHFSTSIYAAVNGTSSSYGAYVLDLGFTPTAPVPLPRSFWLLLTGILLLAMRVYAPRLFPGETPAAASGEILRTSAALVDEHAPANALRFFPEKAAA